MKHLSVLLGLFCIISSCKRKSSIIGLWEVTSCPVISSSDTFNDCQHGMKLMFNFKRDYSIHMFRFDKPATGQYVLNGDTLITIGSKLFSAPDTFIIKKLNAEVLILNNKYCTMNLKNIDSRAVKLLKTLKSD